MESAQLRAAPHGDGGQAVAPDAGGEDQLGVVGTHDPGRDRVGDDLAQLLGGRRLQNRSGVGEILRIDGDSALRVTLVVGVVTAFINGQLSVLGG